MCENVEATDSQIRLPHGNEFSGKPANGGKKGPVLKLNLDPAVLTPRDENIIRTALNEPVHMEEMLNKQQKLVDAIRQSGSFVQCSDMMRRSMLGNKVLSGRSEWMCGSQDDPLCSARMLSSRDSEMGATAVMTKKDAFALDEDDSVSSDPEASCSAHIVKQMTCKFMCARRCNHTEALDETAGVTEKRAAFDTRKTICNIF